MIPRHPLRRLLPVVQAAALTATAILAVWLASASASALDDTPWQIPERPPRCTTAEANSGDVAGCLLTAYRDPSTTGWGIAPAPGVGEGWSWLGYTYNGSPALAEWEATEIVENTEPVAGFRPGYLEIHRYAQPLFEGFLNDISANGYRVRGFSGYSFRCTSGNGGWSCPSGDPDDLSNHAWGLAIDMNAGTNPIRSYESVDGVTACQTPMQTDMPEWVIQTAERWGLYWGGYGWSSGCQSADTQRTRVYRDPPHFEFRGTPEQARAIADFNSGNDPRRRCWDAVDDAGRTIEQCNLTGTPEAGWRLPVEIETPPGTSAVLVNLTATGSLGHGHLSIDDCSPIDAKPSTSAVNFGLADTAAAMVIAPVIDGRFCVYRSTPVHSIVDVAGFLTDEGERFWYTPLDSRRVLDTRRDPVCQGETCLQERVDGLDQRAVPTADPADRLVNLTVTGADTTGYARLGPCDAVAAGDYSHINFDAGGDRANLSLLPGGADPCVWARVATHVIVDELGRLDAERGLGWQVAPARRVLDTRRCTSTWCDGMPTPGVPFEVEIDSAAPAIAVTVTVTETPAPGYAWAGGSCDAIADGKPSTSTVNFRPGSATANMTVITPRDGRICLFTRTDGHVVVDLQAELTAEQAIGLQPADAFRAHDSRPD